MFAHERPLGSPMTRRASARPSRRVRSVESLTQPLVRTRKNLTLWGAWNEGT